MRTSNASSDVTGDLQSDVDICIMLYDRINWAMD